MENNYKCENCNFEYKTKNGLQKHMKLKHSNNDKKLTSCYSCQYCQSNFKYRQSKWLHEQKCKTINNIPLIEQVQKLTEKIKILEAKPTNIINNTMTNSNNKIQYIINAPGTENIKHLSLEKQREIMQKGLNSLTHLIKLNNFNKDVPENHSYCVTSLNDKHASVINPDTNTIIKTDKTDLFDKILVCNLKNLETVSANPKFKKSETNEYKEKIQRLKELLFKNRKSIKKYYHEINLLSYNNKDIIMETWASLKNLDKIIESETDDALYESSSDTESSESDKDEKKEKKYNKIINFYESSSETESEIADLIEIKIKDKIYLLEDDKVYIKKDDGSVGKLYGMYKNGKIKKIKEDNQDIEV